MKILILHAYSAENAGDGLLVTEAMDLVTEALGSDVEVTIMASRPESFRHLPARVLLSIPRKTGYDREFVRALRNIDDFDLIVGVGGGYLRAGTPKEAAKTALAHIPQLFAAGHSTAPSVYLPQSVGPARFGLRPLLKTLVGKVDTFMLRDDRSVAQFGTGNTLRTADLATHSVLGGRQAGREPDERPVLSIRSVHGKIDPGIYELARRLGRYDGYVQSTVGANDDRASSATLSPQRVIPRGELMATNGKPRVIVAMRLHAALMALAAGHYVVHLAYERKGFGAFGDLDLSPWVHNVNGFDVGAVVAQVRELLDSPDAREDYDDRISMVGPRLQAMRDSIVDRLRVSASQSKL
jgi:polysaccharide pyruvyl transferase WcaK-like protein